MKKLLFFTFSCTLLGFSDKDKTSNKSKFLPVFLQVKKDDIPDKENYKIIKKYLLSKGIKILSEDDIQRWFQEQYNDVWHDMKKSNGQIKGGEISEMISSKPIFALQAILQVLKSTAGTDSARVVVFNFPPKGKAIKEYSASNSSILDKEQFLYSVIDSCISRKYFH